MPRRAVPLVAQEHYHVYNRGNNRQPIFFEKENYLFFLRRLRHYLPEGRATVVAYCLMPNHFHLILRPDDDNLSHHFQMLTISYTKAINKKYNRVGNLFQGAFQAKPISRNDYLLHLTRYIHLNPVRAGLVSRPEDWDFSSYCDYVGLRQGTLPKSAVVLAQFPTRQTYQEFVAAYHPSDKEFISSLLLDND